MARPSNTTSKAASAAAPAATGTPEPAAPSVPRARKPEYATIGSKLPMHLELQLCTATTARVTGQFGATTETVHVKTGPVYAVRGTGYPAGTIPKGFPRPPYINDAGFAVTKNIPFEFAEQWFRQNKDTDMVKNGLIMFEADIDSLADMSSDFAKVDSGLGPLTEGDKRNPKPLNSMVSELTKWDGVSA